MTHPLARIVPWDQVCVGEVVLWRNSFAEVTELEAHFEPHLAGQIFASVVLQHSKAHRTLRVRTTDPVAVVLTAERKAQMLDFFREVFHDGDRGLAGP